MAKPALPRRRGPRLPRSSQSRARIEPFQGLLGGIPGGPSPAWAAGGASPPSCEERRPAAHGEAGLTEAASSEASGLVSNPGRGFNLFNGFWRNFRATVACRGGGRRLSAALRRATAGGAWRSRLCRGGEARGFRGRRNPGRGLNLFKGFWRNSRAIVACRGGGRRLSAALRGATAGGACRSRAYRGGELRGFRLVPIPGAGFPTFSRASGGISGRSSPAWARSLPLRAGVHGLPPVSRQPAPLRLAAVKRRSGAPSLCCDGFETGGQGGVLLHENGKNKRRTHKRAHVKTMRISRRSGLGTRGRPHACDVRTPSARRDCGRPPEAEPSPGGNALLFGALAPCTKWPLCYGRSPAADERAFGKDGRVTVIPEGGSGMDWFVRPNSRPGGRSSQ